MALGALVGLQAVALALLALRPPFVLVHDRANGQPPALRQLQLGGHSDERDARLFFTQMVTLRFGWHSSSVRRDLETFLAQCHPTHRKAQLRHLLAHKTAGDALATDGGGSLPRAQRGATPAPSRLDSWQQANLANQVVFPEHWDEVRCRLRAQEPVWDCAMVAHVLTTAGELAAPDAPSGAAGVRATFVASLLEVPHTPKTPYGLLVAHLDMVESAPIAAQAQEVLP